jgi:tetratricopeptide (TPR) repeat protein
LQTSDRGSASQREAYYGLLTTLDANTDQRQQQIAVCLEAIERFPLDAQLLCAMGGYLQAEGRIDMAARAYQTAFEYGQIDPEIWHVPDISEIAAACLSLAQQLLNNEDGARQAIEQALERYPSATRLRRHLIDLHVKHDRRKEALAEFDLLPAETPHREALRSAVRGACLASRQNWTPALAYLQTAYRAGCRDVLCLRWLTVALMGTNDNAAALDVLTAWQSIDPRNSELQHYLQAIQGNASASPLTVADDDRRLRFDTGATTRKNVAPVPNLVATPTINIYGPTGVK